MVKFYPSRLTAKQQKKKEQRKIVLYLFFSFVLVILSFNYGIPLLIRFSLFINDLTQGNQQIELDKETKSSLFPPLINPLPTATNSAKLVVSGRSQEGNRVELFHNNKLIAEMIAGKDGDFQFSELKLNSGENKISAVTVNSDGNRSPTSSAQIVKLLTQKPRLKILEPKDDEVIKNKENKTIIKGETDADNRLTINDRWTIINHDGSFEQEITLEEGKNTINIAATDLAGNINEKKIVITYEKQD